VVDGPGETILDLVDFYWVAKSWTGGDYWGPCEYFSNQTTSWTGGDYSGLGGVLLGGQVMDRGRLLRVSFVSLWILDGIPFSRLV